MKIKELYEVVKEIEKKGIKKISFGFEEAEIILGDDEKKEMELFVIRSWGVLLKKCETPEAFIIEMFRKDESRKKGSPLDWVEKQIKGNTKIKGVWLQIA